ncbi:MAG: DNA recombination protein RmuC [Gammaproteobacteria bacterium]|nr:DNA recombination protein RmuC [Gammaproteobacteria bacterium]
MTASDLIILLLLVAVGAACTGIGILLRQLQTARVIAATANERQSAKQAESNALRERLLAREQECEKMRQQIQQLREDQVEIKTALELERKQFEEKLELLNESKEQLGVMFRNIANEIFEDKTKKFTDTSKQSLASVLGPLQEKIGQFEKRVEETYDKESKQRFSLEKEIKNLQALNARISEDAVNLTNALKGDNKAQGNWGELVLESILENSGLAKGREYEVQVNLRSEDGSKYQPDVIIHLPESRDIIIDSKVSLKAWDAYCSTDSEADRANYLKKHVQSIRNHISVLSGKDYQNLDSLNSLDFVFLFMPLEAAFTTAVREDSGLHQYAFERNIIMVVPSLLLAMLRTVQNLWRLSQQNQNANEIARQAGLLYDKFVGFVDDLEDIGKRIDASRKSYDKAKNKLVDGQGNLIGRAEKLQKLGAKTSKKQKTQLLERARDQDVEGQHSGSQFRGTDEVSLKKNPQH